MATVESSADPMSASAGERSATFVSLREASIAAGVSERTLRRQIDNGELVGLKEPLPHGSGYMWRVEVDSLRKLYKSVDLKLAAPPSASAAERSASLGTHDSWSASNWSATAPSQTQQSSGAADLTSAVAVDTAAAATSSYREYTDHMKAELARKDDLIEQHFKAVIDLQDKLNEATKEAGEYRGRAQALDELKNFMMRELGDGRDERKILFQLVERLNTVEDSSAAEAAPIDQPRTKTLTAALGLVLFIVLLGSYLLNAGGYLDHS